MENTKGIEQKCKYFRITTFVGFVCKELPKQWCCTTMENNASLDKLLIQQTFIEHELWSSHTVLYKERTCMQRFCHQRTHNSGVVISCIWSSVPAVPWEAHDPSCCQSHQGFLLAKEFFGLISKRAIDFSKYYRIL